ncbi:MAG: DMT family transporter [Gemmobacter sp.]
MTATLPPPIYRPLAAAGWMVGSILAFTVIAVSGRELGGRHDTFEILMWRSLIGIVLVVAVAGWAGRLGEISTDRLGAHALRNIVHFIGQNLWFWAVTLIPLAQLFAMEFTTPIWVILLSALFLGERLTLRRTVAAALGFAGILVVARPDFGRIDPGVLAALGAAVAFAVTILMTKVLTRGESLVSIMFWLTGMQFVLGVLTTFHDGQTRWPDAGTIPWLAAIGIGGLIAHYSLTKALSLAPAGFVMPVDFARLPLVAVVGAVLYDERLELALVVGVVLIIAGNIVNLRAGKR